MGTVQDCNTMTSQIRIPTYTLKGQLRPGVRHRDPTFSLQHAVNLVLPGWELEIKSLKC